MVRRASTWRPDSRASASIRSAWPLLLTLLTLALGCGTTTAPLDFGDSGPGKVKKPKSSSGGHDSGVVRLGQDSGGVKVTAANVCSMMNAVCGDVSLPTSTERPCAQTVVCGTCPASQVCNASTHQCEGCPPISCAGQNAACGSITDGCGKSISCGDCAAPLVCDALALKCVACLKVTCQKGNCGTISDGCGGTLSCGDTCEGNEVCQNGYCTPRGIAPQCAEAGAQCGFLYGPCGQSTGEYCGACDAGLECAGNHCAPCPDPSCAGISCGTVATCKGELMCGTCTSPQVCNGTSCCTPMTCLDLPAGVCGGNDGCGHYIPCATCTDGTCDLFSGACMMSSSSSGSCIPGNPCATLCGPQPDGCGHVVQCPATGPQCGASSSGASYADAGFTAPP